MNQRRLSKKARSETLGLINFRRGTGPLKDWPFGCSVSYRGSTFIVAGFDGEDTDNPGPLRVRLVDRMCSVELRDVNPADLTKAVTPALWQR